MRSSELWDFLFTLKRMSSMRTVLTWWRGVTALVRPRTGPRPIDFVTNWSHWDGWSRTLRRAPSFDVPRNIWRSNGSPVGLVVEVAVVVPSGTGANRYQKKQGGPQWLEEPA